MVTIDTSTQVVGTQEDDVIRTASRRDQPTHRRRLMPSPEEVAQTSIHLAVSRLSAGVVVVHVQGEIDMLTAPLFTREVVQVLDPAANLLALDMAQVDFLGASGLSALVDVLDAVERTGGRLWLVFPSRAVRRALDVVGMTGRFNVYPAPVELAS